MSLTVLYQYLDISDHLGVIDRVDGGGGVAIFCAGHISARRRHDLEEDYNECVWIECFLNNIKVLFGT